MTDCTFVKGPVHPNDKTRMFSFNSLTGRYEFVRFPITSIHIHDILSPYNDVNLWKEATTSNWSHASCKMMHSSPSPSLLCLFLSAEQVAYSGFTRAMSLFTTPCQWQKTEGKWTKNLHFALSHWNGGKTKTTSTF